MSYLEPSDSEMGILSASEEKKLWEWQREERECIEEQQEDWMAAVHGCANPFTCEECGLGGALTVQSDCLDCGGHGERAWLEIGGYESAECPTCSGQGRCVKLLCHSCADVQPPDDFWRDDDPGLDYANYWDWQ